MDFMHVGAMPDHRDQEACADHVDQSMPTQCNVGAIAADPGGVATNRHAAPLRADMAACAGTQLAPRVLSVYTLVRADACPPVDSSESQSSRPLTYATEHRRGYPPLAFPLRPYKIGSTPLIVLSG